MKKLNITAFALACGITWGIGVFILSLVAMWSGLGAKFMVILQDMYIGAGMSFTGAFVGMVWAFADAFVGAAVFAFLYNYFVSKFK